jgi:hypothetical protein
MKRRGKRDYPIELIQPVDFDRKLSSAGGPVIILCISREYEFSSQMDILKNVLVSLEGHYAPDLKAYLMDEGFGNGLKEKLGLHGSPTFLLFIDGKEQGRLLGLADEGRLKSFLAAALGRYTGNHVIEEIKKGDL